MPRFENDPERDALYKQVIAEATAADRALASLLMAAVFGGLGREEETGVGPLYLMQAWNIHREPDLRERLTALLRTSP